MAVLVVNACHARQWLKSGARQGNADLAHVFAGAVGIGHITYFV